MAPLTSDSSLSRGRLDWRSRKWQLPRRKVKFCLFAEALSLPPACSIKRAPISAAYLVISPSLACPLSLLLLTPFIAHLPAPPPSLFLHHQSLPFLHGISAMQSRSCPPAPAPALFPSPSSSVRACVVKHPVPCRVHSNSNCARDAGDASLHRQRSGIQPLGTLPRSIPPAPWCTGRLIQCFAGTFWRDDWRAAEFDLVTFRALYVCGGEGENTRL